MNSNRISTILTSILVLCALVVTALVVRRELFPPGPLDPLAPVTIADAVQYARVGHRMGPASARVTIVEFSDFQCPFCKRFADELRTVRAEHPTDVAVVFRHFPLDAHANAYHAAIASECAARQGRFDSYHDQLFANQADLGREAWTKLAIAAGVVDTSAFSSCVSSMASASIIARDTAAGNRLGVTGTPTVLINRTRISGAPSLSALRGYVKRALAGD